MALDEFFLQCDDIAFMATGNDKNRIMEDSVTKNGKFDLYNIEIEILRSIPFTLAIYTLLWLTKFAIDYLMGWLYTKKSASRIYYIVISIHSKLHLVFFMVALMDICFFGARTLAQISIS